MVELKATTKVLGPTDKRQLLNYLKARQLWMSVYSCTMARSQSSIAWFIQGFHVVIRFSR